MNDIINLTFVTAPKKYDSLFFREDNTLKILNTFSSSDNSGKAAYVFGELFCFWRVYDESGRIEFVEFFFRNRYFNSNDRETEVYLIDKEEFNVPYTFELKIISSGKEFFSKTYVSQAYNNYILNVTYDDNDLQEDEILIYFIQLWNNIRKRDKPR